MCSRFDTIAKRDGRTDGQSCYIDIAHQHCFADGRKKRMKFVCKGPFIATQLNSTLSGVELS